MELYIDVRWLLEIQEARMTDLSVGVTTPRWSPPLLATV